MILSLSNCIFDQSVELKNFFLKKIINKGILCMGDWLDIGFKQKFVIRSLEAKVFQNSIFKFDLISKPIHPLLVCEFRHLFHNKNVRVSLFTLSAKTQKYLGTSQDYQLMSCGYIPDLTRMKMKKKIEERSCMKWKRSKFCKTMRKTT